MDGQRHVILVAREVAEFLAAEKENDAGHVLRVGEILRRLAEDGQQATSSKQHFRMEERFPVTGKDVAVFAVKAYQLRVYGGFATVGGRSCFVCVKAVRKRDTKADRSLLKRSAVVLREYL